MLGKVLSMVLGGGGSNNKLIQYADGTLTEVTAEDLKGASNISPYAFVLCNKLTNVTIPDSVTTIGYYAFMQCPELSSITIGSGVTSIGESAFYNCSDLTSITLLPTTPPRLDSSAFSLISSRAVFTVPKGTVDAYKAAPGWSEYASKIVEAAN